MTAFFEHQKTSFKRNYLRTLLSIASSDGTLGADERIVIFRIGKARGLKERHIAEMLDDPSVSPNVFIPEDRSNRMNLLFDVMQVIYADGAVTNREVEFVREVVRKLKFRPEIVDHLIDFFQYGTPTAQDWRDFVDHINETFVC